MRSLVNNAMFVISILSLGKSPTTDVNQNSGDILIYLEQDDVEINNAVGFISLRSGPQVP